MPTRPRTDARIETLFLLWAARETGVLDALMGTAGTPTEVAAETDIPEPVAETVIELLVDSGFLTQVEGKYEPTNRALGFLAKRDLRSIGRLPHALDTLNALAGLPETLRTGETPSLPTDWRQNRIGAAAAIDEQTVRARVTAAVRSAPDAASVLDVCGGAGMYAREFASRGYDVTLLDHPEVVELVTPFLQHHTDSDEARKGAVRLHSGAPQNLDAPVDLAFLGGGLEELDADEAELLILNLVDALAPAGTLVVAGLPEAGTEMAVTTAIRAFALGEGRAHTVEDIVGLFDEAGLTGIADERVPGDDLFVVVGRRQ